MKTKKVREVKLAIDRGNSATKVVASVDGQPIQPFKIASVIRKVEKGDSTVCISGTQHLVGTTAITVKDGEASTPLIEKDKIKDLSVVVAHVLHKILKEECEIILELGVASPLKSEGAKKEILKEIEKLKNFFSVDQVNYRIKEVNRLICESEGSVILKTNKEYTVSIDPGFATLLAAYREYGGEGIKDIPVLDGEMGGVNSLLRKMIDSDKFKDEVRKARYTASPSLEVISLNLAVGNFKLRNIDLAPHLKECTSDFIGRINTACNSAKAFFVGMYGEDPEHPFKPVLIGGGAALMNHLYELEKASKKKLLPQLHSDLVLFDDNPDFQTALIIHQLLITTPSETEIKNGRKKAVRN